MVIFRKRTFGPPRFLAVVSALGCGDMPSVYPGGVCSDTSDRRVYAGMPALADGNGRNKAAARSQFIRCLGAVIDSRMDAGRGRLACRWRDWGLGLGAYTSRIDLDVGTTGTGRSCRNARVKPLWKKAPNDMARRLPIMLSGNMPGPTA